VRFLASVEAAQAWRREHPQALLLTVAQGFALGRAVNRLRLGQALDGAAGSPGSPGGGPLAAGPGMP
jgi:hypothetical protein